MRLNSPLSAVLTCLLLGMFTQVADANPTPQPQGPIVTMPLKRVEVKNGVHPQIKLQQHINRGVRRLATMTGKIPPSHRVLEGHLRKRVETIEGVEALERRFNRVGVPRSETVTLERRFNRQGLPSRLDAEAQRGAQSLKAKDKKKHGHGNHKNANGTVAAHPSGAAVAGQAGDRAAADANAVGGGDSESGVTLADTPTDQDSLGLDIEAQDVGYLATVQIGTPPAPFLILMDSGSADFWVGSENCQSESGGDCGNHQLLGTQSSSTFVDTGKQFQVTYGTGNVQGDIITDNVEIAGLQLNQHTFGVATQESVDFSSDQTPFDGLMGLAQSSLSEQQTPTPVDSLFSANLIKEAIVSFKISRLADNKNDGEITFGGLDQTKFDPATLVSLANVNQDGFWEAALASALVNGVDTGLKGRTTILDTGTTLMVLPSADATTIHNNIPGARSDGQGGFTVPCTTNVSVALTYGGQQFTIDPRDIAFQPVDASDPTGDCVSGIASGDVGGADEWLVGDVFLKNAYFSVDTTNNKISLAKLV